MANTIYILEFEDISSKPATKEIIGGFSNQQKGQNAAMAHIEWLFASAGKALLPEYQQSWGSQSYWELVVWDTFPDVVRTNPTKPKYYYSVRKLRVR